METLKERIRRFEWKLDGRPMRVGLGCAWYGRRIDEEDEVTKELKLLDKLYDLGARVFDTSRDYGNSELLLGKWLKNVPRDSIFLSTKSYYPFYEPDPLETLKRNFYESFERLGVDHIDFFMIHDTNNYGACEREAIPFLLDRKAEGLIDYIGQGTRSVNAHAHAVAAGVMDGFLTYRDFCLNCQSARPVALEAKKAGVMVMNGSPLADGVLVRGREPDPASQTHRTLEDARFTRRLCALLEEMGVDLIAAALQYPLLFDEIDMNLTAINREERLTTTLAALRADIRPDQWARIFALQEEYPFFHRQIEV